MGNSAVRTSHVKPGNLRARHTSARYFRRQGGQGGLAQLGEGRDRSPEYRQSARGTRTVRRPGHVEEVPAEEIVGSTASASTKFRLPAATHVGPVRLQVADLGRSI